MRGSDIWRHGVVAALVVGRLLLPGAAGASTTYTSAAIPPNLDFGAVSVSPSGLVLSGSATLDGDQGVDCLFARVKPTTLTLSSLVEPLCSDTPLLSGHSVAVLQTEARTMVTSVRIAHLTPTGHPDIGPVVVTYTQLSDTHLETVRAAGSLWLYAPNTPSGGRALRVSETTGQVLQNTPVSPAMDRPIIAANQNGLYLAPASNTGFLGSGRAPNENGIIYHVGIGASGVQVFDASPGTSQFSGDVSWVTGDGNSLWADICQRPVGTGCVITRFNGSNPKPVFQASDHNMTGSWVVGSASQGFYSVVSPANSSNQAVNEAIVHIDPSSGAVRPIATLPLPAFWQGNFFSGSSEAALFDDAFYLLVPPGTPAGSPGALYRVPLSARS